MGDMAEDFFYQALEEEIAYTGLFDIRNDKIKKRL